MRTLPFPNNISKSESYNSFSQFDYVLSANHFLTGTYHVAPQHTNFVNLGFFDQQPVTPSFRASSNVFTVADHLALGGTLLTSTVSVQNFDAKTAAQGTATMVLTPGGNQGNYYLTRQQDASRVEWLEALVHSIPTPAGTHTLKFGTTVATTDNNGDLSARSVAIQDAAVHRLKQIFLSYVRSRARGDLNDFSRYLGDFPSPVVQPNQFSTLPGDLPNRFLAWGFFPLPWQMRVAPIVEYHTGFSYAPIDAARNYVGVPYSDRFRYPSFFSADARVSKDVKVNENILCAFP